MIWTMFVVGLIAGLGLGGFIGIAVGVYASASSERELKELLEVVTR